MFSLPAFISSSWLLL